MVARRKDHRQGFGDILYFMKFVHAEGWLLVLVIFLSVLSTLFRLPIIYLPTVLAEHFYLVQEGSGEASMSANFFFGLAKDLTLFLWHRFGVDHYLIAYVWMTGICLVLLAPLQALRTYGSTLVGGNLLERLRIAIYRKLSRLSMLAIYERGAGSFVQQLNRDLFLLHDFLLQTLSSTLPLILQIAIYLTTLLWMNTPLTLFALLSFAAVQPMLYRINLRIQDQAIRLQGLYEGVTNFMMESIGGYRDVMAAGRFEDMTQRFEMKCHELRTQNIHSILWSEAGEFLLNILFSCLTVLPYILLVKDLRNIAQVGQVITYVVLLASLLPSLAGLWGLWVQYSSSAPSLRVIRRTLEHSEESTGVQTIGSARPMIESIRFEHVGLQIGDRWILHDLDFEIRGGGMTAVIGQSGAGKTTLFYLLLRLMEPSVGCIWINDRPLNSIPEAELRAMIGFIPQNPFLFNVSLRENLTLSDHDPADLSRVIEEAQLEEVVRKREAEGGLDAPVGYLGMSLSGGEKQRVALARLLLQNPAIIVCDEYTANIDVKTARLIQDMMSHRFEGLTRIVITHELYSAKGAQAILVLDQGALVQAGTHEELVQEPGLYQELWEAQRLS